MLIFFIFEIENKAVLIHNGWTLPCGTPKILQNHPFLTENATWYLKDRKVGLVGIDSHNVNDDTRGKPASSYNVLGAENLIVEHLCNLASIPEGDFIFNAIPPKLKGVGTFPVLCAGKIALKQNNAFSYDTFCNYRFRLLYSSTLYKPIWILQNMNFLS
jgi:kynurenine formamidase